MNDDIAFGSGNQNPYIRLLPKLVSSNVEIIGQDETNKRTNQCGGNLLRFEDNSMFQDATSIRTGVRLGFWDLPHGPESGPEMPKKKRPQIL